MCGIIGYTGSDPAVPILLDGLKKLEYRGYDSAGIAVQTADGLHMVKATGKVEKLDRLPLTPNGKIDRKALKAQYVKE